MGNMKTDVSRWSTSSKNMTGRNLYFLLEVKSVEMQSTLTTNQQGTVLQESEATESVYQDSDANEEIIDGEGRVA